ncbi:MAG: DUF1631 family protein, partial [Gammaproteobacteria bacterium]
MKFEDPEILESTGDSDWGRRRTNMRHEVAIPGRITDQHGIRLACEIEDVSSSGMALALESHTPEPGREPLEQGTLATLEFAPDPMHAPEQQVSVRCRVMWRAPVAVGISFQEQTPELRAALRTIAQAAVIARVNESQQRGRGLGAEQRQTLQACRKTVQKMLPNMMWVLRTELVKRLRAAASSASGTDAKEALAEAERIEEHAMAISRAIEQRVLQGFGQASDLDETQELTLMQIRRVRNHEASHAEMVDDRAAEQNARITALAQAIEDRFKSAFFELNVRMANVLGHPLDENTNPLVPGNACRIIWHSVTEQADSLRVQQELKAAMLEKVMPLLGEIYGAVNETLDGAG